MLGQAFGHFVQLKRDDLLDILFVQRAEDDGGIQAVDELGTEGALERFVQVLAHLLVGQFLGGGFVAFHLETQPGLLLDQVGADVGGHHDDGVAEVHLAAFGVAQVSFLHNLQKHVVNFGMRLLDFIEHDDRIRSAAQGFGQLSRVFVADVSGRRAHQAGGGVALHELGHVQLDGRVLAPEHELGQGLGQLGLADAGRAEEHE